MARGSIGHALYFAKGVKVLFNRHLRFIGGGVSIVLLSACGQMASSPAPLYQESLYSCRGTYEVKWGDTLSEVAMQCGMDVQTLAEINHIPKPYRIFVGQTLHFDLADTNPKNLPSVKPLPQGLTGWVWPSQSQSPYEFVKTDGGQKAIRIYGKKGDGVLAVAKGKVVYVGTALEEYGQLIMLRHDEGLMSVYAHNDGVLVNLGEEVQAGQLIAYMGQTGNTQRVNLYLEARQNGQVIDVDGLITVK